MEATTLQLVRHWLALPLFVVAAGLLTWLIVERARHRRWSLGLLLAASSFLLFGLGGLELFEPGGFAVTAPGFWLTVIPLAVLAILLAVVFSHGHCSSALRYLLGAILLFGLGQGIISALQDLLTEGAKLLASLDPLQPLWLLLLLLVPLIIWLSFRSLSGLGPVRKWVAIGL